jgi:sigma-B regulation protein RsbU (phosphoserine phosphatase)
MAITHALAHARPRTHTPPGHLLKHLNNHLARSYTRGETFVTAFYAVLDPVTRTLTYATAGHNPPRLARGNRVISLDEDGALPLGILDERTYAQTTITLQPNDLLLLYTDGITETMAPPAPPAPRELFGIARLDQLLLNCHAITPDQCLSRIRSEVATFSDQAPPADDQTLIAIRCL